MRKLIVTFKSAFQESRKNFLHTLLSVLGIVIGVGALVSILSLIDGLEKYAHEQISQTTSLESIIITTQTTERIDNLRLTKEAYAYFDYEAFRSLAERLEKAQGYLLYQESGYLSMGDSTERGALLTGIVATPNETVELLAGSFFTESQLLQADTVTLLSKELVSTLAPTMELEAWIGTPIVFKEQTYRIVGIVDTPQDHLQLFVPITVVPNSKLQAKPPKVVIQAPTIEDVPQLKNEIEDFTAAHFGEGAQDFSIITNEFRVAQANQGFLIFRLIMGMIVGISVLVGGIGIMNVLLISVNERTAEIGVRKAVGAKKKDIVVQFLSESLIISLIGSFLGVLLGVAFTLVAVPIVKHLTEMPFEAAYTLNTLAIISTVAMTTGVVFGTYPALKASKLDPVEAIRRE